MGEAQGWEEERGSGVETLTCQPKVVRSYLTPVISSRNLDRQPWEHPAEPHDLQFHFTALPLTEPFNSVNLYKFPSWASCLSLCFQITISSVPLEQSY